MRRNKLDFKRIILHFAFCLLIPLFILAVSGECVYATQQKGIGLATEGVSSESRASTAIALKYGEEAIIFTDAYKEYDKYIGFDKDGNQITYDITFAQFIYYQRIEDNVAAIYICKDERILNELTLFKYITDVSDGEEYDVVDIMDNRSSVVFNQYDKMNSDENQYLVSGKYSGNIEYYPAAVIKNESLAAIIFSKDDDSNALAYNIWFDEQIFLNGQNSTQEETEENQEKAEEEEETKQETTEEAETEAEEEEAEGEKNSIKETTGRTIGHDDESDEISQWVWVAVALVVGATLMLVVLMILKSKKKPINPDPIDPIISDPEPILPTGNRTDTQMNSTILIDEDDVIEAMKEYALKGEGGSMNGRIYPVQYPISIGRDVDCSIRYNAQETSISRHHAYVFVKDQQLFIRDSSKSGTYIIRKNSDFAERLNREQNYLLNEGDRIFIAGKSNGFRVLAK